ncbi:pro-pol polyprotein [Lasius niger]|uniref:Pro-pol polyprotein n=1 Tax=Lasius niger TaxID=67767 RepID=A0A0J7KLJ9_LASNI|nr:pro-pol polyprotein [Lasius niger]
MGATAADLLYGETIRLPGEFLASKAPTASSAADYVKDLRQHFEKLRPTNGTHHGERRTSVFKNLKTTDQVFVRHDAVGGPLQQPYDGPYRVVSRNAKTFVVHIRGKDVTVSVDRLKPAYVIAKDEARNQANSPQAAQRPESPSSTGPSPELASPTDPGEDTDPPLTQEPTSILSRSGRRVRFPDRLQGGFS